MKNLAVVFASLVAAACLAVGALAGADGQARSQTAGERLFVEQGCYGCHMVGKFGTPIGPDLSHVGARFSEPMLARWLADPAAQRPRAHMPKIELAAADVTALAAYLAALQ